MTEFGKTLKVAREAKGLTAKQVAEATHMLIQVVEGLENEDFSRIAAPIYGRGFVKLYCEAVGLEPKPLVDAFMELYAGVRVAGLKPVAEPPPRREPPPPPPEPVAAEPPRPSELDFGSGQAAASALSRYATPRRDDEPRSHLPYVNWRIAVLLLAAAVLVVLFALGVRALYHATMAEPEKEQQAEEPAAPAKAPEDRKPLPLRPFYLDSDHSTETERK